DTFYRLRNRLTSGLGVLPDGPLNAAVGGTMMFTTTLTPPEKPFVFVGWIFIHNNIDANIISSTSTNNTTPTYEGRITLFRSIGSLELRNLSLNDSGEYRVTITPDGGVQMTGSTRLEILVTVSNTDLVEFNSSVSLSCSSSGSSLSFHWLNGSSEVTASDRVQLTDGNRNFTLINVTRYDQGPFRCRVFNPVSDGTSDPVNFSISCELLISMLIFLHENYLNGSNIDLSCSADSKPSAQFKWFLNGSLLFDTGPELRLMNVQKNQSGNYICQAFNNKTLRYQTSQPSAITVVGKLALSRPTIACPTENLIEGKTSVNLSCNADGFVPTRAWMKDGKPLVSGDRYSFYDGNRVLSISPVDRKDTGEFLCNVSNDISFETAKCRLDVHYGPDTPIIVQTPIGAELEESVTLSCFADSLPKATFSWRFRYMEKPGPLYYIKEMEEKHLGKYICTARNAITGLEASAVHTLTDYFQAYTFDPIKCISITHNYSFILSHCFLKHQKMMII
uniref:Ig-like domain-containing protein n=1 Tax=Anabas testudineus TaxID=64144 RepID=A0A3Q1J9U6_ANATE